MKRALLRYYGGKHKLAPWIVSFFPEHHVYVEPFCGAASVFFRKERSYGEVLNDMSDDIVSLFRVLRDKQMRAELAWNAYLTPYARTEYVLAHQTCTDPVEKARRLLVRSMMGFYSDSVNPQNNISGFRNDSMRSWSLPVHNWRDYPKYIEAFAERLRGVIIENTDAFTLFEKWGKNENYLWYLDPPYPHKVRTSAGRHKYFFEMTDADHERLIATILTVKGKVVLSGYDTPLYQPLLASGWRVAKKNINNAMFNQRTECLWMNFAEGELR